MYEDLKIIYFPDPRLKRISVPVKEFNGDLATLSQKMLELMRAARGVGLAAPQVGLNLRLFVTNHTGKPEDDRVYVNPTLFDAEGEEVSEEGCLSIPALSVEVVRAVSARMNGKDVTGAPIDQHEKGYVARIWQHELDHLNGTLLIDRMGPTAEMENRKLLKELEDKYAEENPPAKKKGK